MHNLALLYSYLMVELCGYVPLKVGILHNSGIDLLKVGIPKLSANAGIEQPHSRITGSFKTSPCDLNQAREAAMMETLQQHIGDFVANLVKHSKVLTHRRLNHQIAEFLKDIH